MTESDAHHPQSKLLTLIEHGVIMPRPDLVVIGREVPLEAIVGGATLAPFAQVYGPRTRIGPGAEIGAGGPAVLTDAWVGAGARVGTMGPVTLRGVTVGPGAVLGSGAAEDAVFLGKEADDPAISAGLGFRVRRGSLYEEDANSAQHTDTKMTVLFPWATLGSNVNWCDLLMAGGVGPAQEQFSEAGSGAVHFNFTPRADKATGSLLGDVVQGVFLRAPRIFIGGNASLIGPARVAYGAFTAAGRRFAGTLEPGLHPGLPEAGEATPRPFEPEVYGAVKRIYETQVRLIAELAALDAWYGQARALLAADDGERAPVYQRGRAMVRANIAERIAQLGRLAGHMERSLARLEAHAAGDRRIGQQRALLAHWPEVERHLRDYAAAHSDMPEALREGLLAAAGREGRAYTRVVRALDAAAVRAGQDWLAGIVARVASPEILERVPPLSGA